MIDPLVSTSTIGITYAMAEVEGEKKSQESGVSQSWSADGDDVPYK